MSQKKTHIPAPGRSSGLVGEALCGRWAHYTTGDHDLLRRLAVQAAADGESAHYCAECLDSVLSAAKRWDRVQATTRR